MEDKDPMENGFTDQFEADGESYMISVKHFLVLSKEEQRLYKVQDGQFLVHLFSHQECKTFRVFLNDELYWVSNAEENFVPREFIEVIGSIIDERSFLGK